MINLALIGVGRWGVNYLQAAKELDNCRIKYVCSPNIASNKEIDGSYVRVQSYSSLSKFKDIDGIIIATPASTHYKIARYFLKKNINLLIEKPITLNTANLIKLKELYEKSYAKILIGHLYKYNHGYILLKKKIKYVGKIISIEFINYSKGQYRQDVSEIWDRMYHDVYIFYDILQSYPLSVSSKYIMSKDRVNRVISTKIFLNGGANISIKTSSQYSKKIRKILIKGEKGKIVFDDVKKKINIHSVNLKDESFHFDSDNPLKTQINNFIVLINSSRKPNLKEAINTSIFLEACQKSLRSKNIIKINEYK